MTTCETFDLATRALCTKPGKKTMTAICGHGHTKTARACTTHGRALRNGELGCRVCFDAGHHCEMIVTN
jgi:hypothetical protein